MGSEMSHCEYAHADDPGFDASSIPHGAVCSCTAVSDTALGEPVGDVPPDGAIAEIVAALKRGEDEIGL